MISPGSKIVGYDFLLLSLLVKYKRPVVCHVII